MARPYKCSNDHQIERASALIDKTCRLRRGEGHEAYEDAASQKKQAAGGIRV